jgi:hypothetical protein
MVDVETDGPIPGDYSLISLGAVLVNEAQDKTFYGRFRPISDRFIPEALAVSGHTREETLQFEEPATVMRHQNFKHLRRTTHTHHPVDDAKGNAEALLTMKKEMGLKIKLG